MSFRFPFTRNVYFSSFVPLSVPLLLCILTPVYARTDIFLRRGDPFLIYLPSDTQSSSWFVYAAIRLFCSYKYLMPLEKSHLTAEAKCISYRYRYGVRRCSTTPAYRVYTDVNSTNSLGYCISGYLHFIASSQTPAISVVTRKEE